MTSHVLIALELGRGYGHVARAVSMGRALIQTGITVSLAIPSPSLLRPEEREMFNFVESAPVPRRSSLAQVTQTYHDIVLDAGFNSVDALIGVATGWQRIFKRTAVSAVIAEHAPACIFSALAGNLPVIHAGSGFIVPALPLAASLRPWDRHAPERVGESIADRCVRDAAAKIGIKTIDGLSSLLRRAHRLVITFEELDHLAPRSDRYLDPLPPRCGGKDIEWPGRRKLRAFVYLPARNAHSAIIAAALKQEWSVLWHASDIVSDVQTDNAYYSKEPLNTESLQIADIVVARAGHGISTQALLKGVPHLLLPDRTESALLAYRLNRQMLGLVLPASQTIGNVETTLRGLAHNTIIRTAVNRAQQRVANYSPNAAMSEFAAQVRDALERPTQ